MRASSTNRSIAPGSVHSSLRRTLITARLRISGCSAANTTPIPPTPIFASIRYSPTIMPGPISTSGTIRICVFVGSGSPIASVSLGSGANGPADYCRTLPAKQVSARVAAARLIGHLGGDDGLADRSECATGELQVHEAERDADDRHEARDRRHHVTDREPQPGDHEPHDVADSAEDAGAEILAAGQLRAIDRLAPKRQETQAADHEARARP